MRTGADYLKSLNDGRCVYIDGERVADVASHPAFAGAAKTIAGLYDMIADPAHHMTFYSPKTGEPVYKAYMIPRTREEQAEKRVAMKKSADATYGLMGRSPDHIANFLAGFAGASEVFNEGGGRFAENVVNFYEYARDHHLFLTYTIVHPQVDRSKPANQWENPYLACGVLEERKDGIVIRGAQMLATSGALTDYLFVSVISPLHPGDEKYAISLVVPMNARGLKLYVRRSYAVDKPSVYDYPLSTRFDETDALAVFEDVFVPWEHVFVYKNIELTNKQFFATPAHIYGNVQAQIRLTSKLQFIAGLAKKVAETTGIIKLPPVQGRLGELVSRVSVHEGLVLAAEASGTQNDYGQFVPNPRYLYSAMALQPKLYHDILFLVRELTGGGMLQVPSSYKDFLNPDTSHDIRRYIQSPGVPAEKRVQLFKLVWDLVGSEFAGRHHQYEMFYGGPPHVVKGQAFRNYGFEEADRLVETCLSSYSLEQNETF
ncbi:4-hydroxyphenylacetate 3-hydroxylase N-terminal domain-containing protein [Kyrpidia sp.]|uniref:4-hydroxyphenylacetate 3-hydroxylase family protein n=1 Tax=Kyrpidia sp. TaxID=2073077 RepID=UPI002589C15E|nr:4-hydroxyphenylacetate 3-hydroxylase N-terminal domain-containing protein [Kyrpidia sp.]MCL6577442.1 hypothetical protein [Kyrpidia sp.]